MLLGGKPILPRSLGRQLTTDHHHATHLETMKTAKLLRLNFEKPPLVDVQPVLGQTQKGERGSHKGPGLEEVCLGRLGVGLC